MPAVMFDPVSTPVYVKYCGNTTRKEQALMSVTPEGLKYTSIYAVSEYTVIAGFESCG